jgi:hypothetical protein
VLKAKNTYQAYCDSYLLDTKSFEKTDNGFKLIKEHGAMESHNFYVEMLRHFKALDFLLLFYCLFLLVYPFSCFSIMCSLLFLLYGITLATPFNFILAALGVIGRKKQL